MTEEQIYEKTLELAEKLSAEKCGQLIEELAIRLAQPPGEPLSDDEFEAAWAPVMKQRLDDILAGRTKTIPWSEVKRRLKEKRERRKQAT